MSLLFDRFAVLFHLLKWKSHPKVVILPCMHPKHISLYIIHESLALSCLHIWSWIFFTVNLTNKIEMILNRPSCTGLLMLMSHEINPISLNLYSGSWSKFRTWSVTPYLAYLEHLILNCSKNTENDYSLNSFCSCVTQYCCKSQCYMFSKTSLIIIRRFFIFLS